MVTVEQMVAVGPESVAVMDDLALEAENCVLESADLVFLASEV